VFVSVVAMAVHIVGATKWVVEVAMKVLRTLC
jgi:hypothetical protein